MPNPKKVYPWRRVVRTTFQSVVSFAPIMPFVYEAATNHDPAAATGLAGTALAVSAGITRVMALPKVESWLQKYVPILAANPKGTSTVVPSQ
jgi:hypothetical protein